MCSNRRERGEERRVPSCIISWESEPKRMSEYDTPRNQDPGQYILGSQAKGGWEFWQVRWRTKAVEANLTFVLVCLPSICGNVSERIRPR